MKKKTKAGSSECLLASALDVFGDKWSLLIIYCLASGPCRYGDFVNSPYKWSTNILANRLRKMEAHGLVRRGIYRASPLRLEYALTDSGRSLLPVIETIKAWRAETKLDAPSIEANENTSIIARLENEIDELRKEVREFLRHDNSGLKEKVPSLVLAKFKRS